MIAAADVASQLTKHRVNIVRAILTALVRCLLSFWGKLCSDRNRFENATIHHSCQTLRRPTRPTQRSIGAHTHTLPRTIILKYINVIMSAAQIDFRTSNAYTDQYKLPFSITIGDLLAFLEDILKNINGLLITILTFA